MLTIHYLINVPRRALSSLEEEMRLVTALLHQISKLRVLAEACLASLSQVTCPYHALKVGLSKLVDRVYTPAILLVKAFHRLLRRVKQIIEIQ